jgi:hypothetical protein
MFTVKNNRYEVAWGRYESDSLFNKINKSKKTSNKNSC